MQLLLFSNNQPLFDWLALGGQLAAGMSFSRASSGTRFNPSGVLESLAADTPRFDFNPATLSLRGLLIEEQRTNGMYPSVVDGGATWVPTNATATTNAGTAPDGTSNATLFKDTSATAQHQDIAGTGFSFVSGTVYTASIYAKAGTAHVLQLWTQSGQGAVYANFDLNSGAAGTYTSTGASITPVGNGWYRCVMTITAINTNSVAPFGLALTNDNSGATGRLPSYTGSVKGVYVWGAQFETGSFATSYIPTTSSSVTRAGDAMSFTIPAGVTTLRYAFDDNSTQDVAVSPGGYSVPVNLNRRWIKRITSL